jgi:DNA-damage-inducible protein J
MYLKRETKERAMASSSMLHVRIDDKVKAEAAAVLGSMGLTASDAVRLLFHRIITDQAFPIELKAPNARTREAMAEADEILRARRLRFSDGDELFADLEKNSGR